MTLILAGPPRRQLVTGPLTAKVAELIDLYRARENPRAATVGIAGIPGASSYSLPS
jgi:hypothetical protein